MKRIIENLLEYQTDFSILVGDGETPLSPYRPHSFKPFLLPGGPGTAIRPPDKAPGNGRKPFDPAEAVRRAKRNPFQPKPPGSPRGKG